MDWGALASWAAVIVSIVIAIRAYVSERRSKRSAEDAEELKRRTVSASERSAKAVEEVASAIRDWASASSAESEPLLVPGPTWSLEHVNGSKYALVNRTQYPQDDVKISGDAVLRGPIREVEVPAFQEVQFMGLNAWGVSDQVTVTWTDNLNEKQEWTKALPPKR